jgi:hypothetical protein
MSETNPRNVSKGLIGKMLQLLEAAERAERDGDVQKCTTFLASAHVLSQISVALDLHRIRHMLALYTQVFEGDLPEEDTRNG